MPAFGLSHIHLPVPDLGRARRFYEKGLGFEVREEDPQAVVLDGLGVLIRLMPGEAVTGSVELSLQTTQVRASTDCLLAAGATLVSAADQQPDGTLEAVVLDPQGYRLRLWRRLREDELDEEPALPLTMPWESAAEDLLRAFLRQTPVMFRDLARQGCVREAEHLAREAGTVRRRTVARALIRATPRMLRFRIRQPLLDNGFDPEEFAEDFQV